MDEYKYSKTQSKKKGISGLNPDEYLLLDEIIEDKKKNKYNIYIPYSWNASKIIASKKVNGIEGKWCTSYQKDISFWIDYILQKEVIIVYLKSIKGDEVYAIELYNVDKFKLWDKNDNEVNYNRFFNRDNNTINIFKKILNMKKIIEKKYNFYIEKELKEYLEKYFKLDKILDLIKDFSLIINNKKIREIIELFLIENDKTGQYCYWFARDVKNADVEKLQNAVIQKNSNGQYCYWFARDVKNADIKKLQDCVVKSDEEGYYCYSFALNVEGVNIQELQNCVIKKDKDGFNCYRFIKDIDNINKQQFLQRMKEKFGENNKWYKKALKLIKK